MPSSASSIIWRNPLRYTDLKFELRSDGKWFVRGRVEQEVLMTNRFILRPWVDGSAAGKDVDATVRKGFYLFDVALQARYGFSRKFAPYVEISRSLHPRAIAGGEPDAMLFLLGLRLIF